VVEVANLSKAVVAILNVSVQNVYRVVKVVKTEHRSA
jgi:hypothetical protein